MKGLEVVCGLCTIAALAAAESSGDVLGDSNGL